jgi:negative regulator of flagellin synthesis FlgM
MDIRNSLEGLKTLLGVTPPGAAPQRNTSTATSGANAAGSDRATFSSAGSQVSQASAEPDVRLDKVASIQAALAAGTYNVPASAVASRLVGAMLGGNQ